MTSVFGWGYVFVVYHSYFIYQQRPMCRIPNETANLTQNGSRVWAYGKLTGNQQEKKHSLSTILFLVL